MNKTHLPDGSIIDADTGEEIMSAQEAAGENDYRLTAARNFLATAPESDFRKLLADLLDVANDYIATDLDQNRTQTTYEGGVYFRPEDVRRLCPTCLSRVTATP